MDESYFGWREATPPDYKYKNGEFMFSDGCPLWYFRGACDAISQLAESKGNDTVANRPNLLARMRRLAAAMLPGESYHYYYQLVKQERWMLRSGADWKVFEYALDRFPSLRRVTISTKVHGKLFMPRYETPLIRSFPYNFVYALPGPWPFPDAHQTSRIIWKDKDAEPSNEYKVFRRGLCSALRVLAKHGKHKVSGFIVEDHEGRKYDWHRQYRSHDRWRADEYTARMDDRGYTFDDLCSLIQRPGFQRLSLDHEHYRRLFKAFEKAESLRSLCLYGDRRPRREHRVDIPTRRLILPECLVQQLHSLVLEKISVHKDGLITLLDSLISLQYLELRSVGFEACGGEELTRRYGASLYETYNPRDFLFDLRDKTGWRDRSLRPTVTIQISEIFLEWPRSQRVKLDSEIGEFLYRHGDSPYLPSEYTEWTYWRSEKFKPIYEYCAGKGTLMMEELDPESERPDVDTETLEHLGIISVQKSKEPKGRRREEGPRGNGPRGDAVWADELWGYGPWGYRTCPTLQEQGCSKTASTSSPSCF
ncbi:uncharacterized protein B0J16DRAFT_399713 [Fusarium flagelliforme]|uniref:uncharacterized protein n=1 Tax=Fusarium flagelliforme TaxID=2675880 RepID=UPI001E8DE68E|nr:uncharacterized protein B0J16DRAFT_399713 [Fusarium flagelliforme]KAH7185887.1 hypothetical protein B0J16DRAFT_399713 [Fusarium flagelliforme]